MTYDLYLDVLFMINFTMNFLMLSITGRTFSYDGSILRRGLAAAIGALWALAAAAFGKMPPLAETLVSLVAAPGLMVWISYNLRKPGEIPRAGAALYLVTALTAGIIEVLYRYTRAGWYGKRLARGDSTAAMPLAALVLLAAGTYFGLRAGLIRAKEYQKKRKHLYEVTMHYRGKEKTVTALLDTGNGLYDPTYHLPVHVVTYQAVKEICSGVSRVIYIPYKSVGKEQGMLPGIFLDRMEVKQGGEIRVIEKPLVAVLRQPLSGDNAYQMLLHEF